MATITITNAAKVAPPVPNIYITDTVGTGTGTTYKVHVINEPFVGYVRSTVTSNTINSRNRTVRISKVNNITSIPAQSPLGYNVEESNAISLPIGEYNCSFITNENGIPQEEAVYHDIRVTYSITEMGTSVAGTEGIYNRPSSIIE